MLSFSLLCSSEENDINPKVLQLIHGEKIKVRAGSGRSAALKPVSLEPWCWPVPQTGRSVTPEAALQPCQCGRAG